MSAPTKPDIPQPTIWWDHRDSSNVTLAASAENITAWEINLTSLLQLYDVRDLLTEHDPNRPKACRSFLKLLEDSVETDLQPIVAQHTITHEAFAALKRLVPSDARAFEDLMIKSADIHIKDCSSAAEFVTTSRNVHQTFISMYPEHHYSQPLTFLYRILRGVSGVPELSAARLKYSAIKQVDQNTILDVYRDIQDSWQTPDRPQAFAEQGSRTNVRHGPGSNAGNFQHGVDYSCMLYRRNDHSSQECELLTKLWENQRTTPKRNIFYSRHARKVVVTRTKPPKPTATANAVQPISGATLTADESLQNAAEKLLQEHAGNAANGLR